MTTYSTPGVWVEEIPTLASSVAQVATAVPAFIGYTEKGFKEGGTVARIDTLLDYVTLFGEAPPSYFTATVDDGRLTIDRTEKGDYYIYLMYYGLSLYFRNGGGTCYIVSIGNYKTADGKDKSLDKADFKMGLDLLEKEDEPTLIVLLDAVNLPKYDYYELAQQALAQCHNLGDRFLILDVPGKRDEASKNIADFRNGTGIKYLNYAAAYHPYLQTTLTYQYTEENIKVSGIPPIPQWTSGANGITVTNLADRNAKVKVVSDGGTGNDCSFTIMDGNTLVIGLPNTQKTGNDVVKEWGKGKMGGFEIIPNGEGTSLINQTPSRWRSSGDNGIDIIYSGNSKASVKIFQGETAYTHIKAEHEAELKITLAANARAWKEVFNAWNLLPSKPPGFDVSLNVDGKADIAGLTSKMVIDEALNVVNKSRKPAKIEITNGSGTAVSFNAHNDKLTIILGAKQASGSGASPNLASTIYAAWSAYAQQKNPIFDITLVTGKDTVDILPKAETPMIPSLESALTVAPIPLKSQTLKTIKTTDSDLYNRIKAELGNQRIVLPPSPAIAGIYVQVDRDRGVWKAPANVSVASVLGPVTKISDVQQETLNVDPTGGKSINVIRAFIGKGTLVWGARTLEGNSNEWRYVPVRRLFITIEESTRKASSFAVFEPNDAMTWLKVKAMIDSYLYGLWEQGALAGSRQEQAYYVNVGLGKTMTAQDILEGRMIVEIGVAAVRPAEFIILRFSHKMQEA